MTDGRDLGLREVESVRLVHEVTNQLRNLILNGSIAPGTKLVQEQVAAQLGISRTPLREAFRVLQQEQLIRVSPRTNSVEVAVVDDRDALAMYQLREVIDGLATRLAAENGEPAEGWQPLIDRTRGLRGAGTPFQPRRVFEADGNFHLAMVGLARNAFLDREIPVIRMSILTLYRRMPRDGSRIDNAVDEHLEILDAVMKGKADLAEKLAREHIRKAVKYWFR